MTEKRYFKRIWEEEYYIFDSETISENEFDEKVEYEDYQAFADSMQGDEVVNKLNQLNDENEQLKLICQDHRDHAIDFKADCVRLEKENDQLKERNQELFDDLQYKTSLLSLRGGELAILKRENEELKQQNADWETSFDICKHYKEAYGDEIVHIKQTIKDMMDTERTELGRSVLRQLWEAIQ